MKKILFIFLIAFVFLNILVSTQDNEYDLDELYACAGDCKNVTDWFKKNELYEDFFYACRGGKANVYRECYENFQKSQCSDIVGIFWDCYVD